jgi:ribosomal-protein-alanine N-acetyltransferase
MFTEEDLDALSLITGDPEVMKYLGTSEPRSREKTRNTIDAILRHWEQHGFGIFALEHKADRRLIGWCGLQRLEKTPEVEVAYLLAKEYWNQGLATEAARAAIRYGFDELKLGRVVAIARPENVGSYRVMEKAGMKYERDANYYNVDVVYYALDLKP